MKTRKQKIIHTILIIIGVLILPLMKLHAEDLRSIDRLSGYWKFSIGDNKVWIDPDFDDSDWDEIRVPDSWESEGYEDYNGYAWYRKQFKFSYSNNNRQLYLLLGHIDDCDEVYLNGTLIGKSGSLPPHFVTAYNTERKYLIPDGLLKRNGDNLIAVRVYDTYAGGGIVYGRVGIYFDEDVDYLNMELSGYWKFRPGNDREWRLKNYNDSDWDEISVPASWESQGYEDYDGYAWYRKDFRLPSSLANEELYISLGKIDDFDRVYLNGEEIGEVYDLEKNSEYPRKGYEYNARRVYAIPDGLLNKNKSNTISIRVYDERLTGGIYEGPIGLMDEENYRDYKRKHHQSRGFWDYVIDKFSY